MIPFPLPPLLARLHEALEHYTEERERGFFLAEQQRNFQARAQPVLIFVTAQQLDGEKSDTRNAPAWMGEVGDAIDLAKHAAAGVREVWRVRAEGTVAIEVFREPGPAGYGARAEFRDEEPVVSGVFVDLALRPRDLLG
ncbi:MAG: hypothetical protein AB7N76_14560 [Planctomycetota bacterium]